jgi:hypothetical protein
MSNALNPEQMTPAEQIAEIARILALGLMRLRAQKSSETVAPDGECFVDFSPVESVHAPKGERP